MLATMKKSPLGATPHTHTEGNWTTMLVYVIHGAVFICQKVGTFERSPTDDLQGNVAKGASPSQWGRISGKGLTNLPRNY